MQNIEQANRESRVLTDCELEEISGASIFGRIAHFVHDLFAGPGDHRRPTDQP
jgi:hypothetical protein